MEPHGVSKEVTKQCTNKDHYQSPPHPLTGDGGVSGAQPTHLVITFIPQSQNPLVVWGFVRKKTLVQKKTLAMHTYT